jgi:uncharacterized membrane protein YagU involved in acid resistance
MNSSAYTSSATSAPRLSPILAIFIIWLVAGTLDISENLIFNHFRAVTPTMVFQYIASGLIGMRSFTSGNSSVVLGVLLHYTIALIWTLVFFAASRFIGELTRYPVFCGLIYGLFVYLVMNLAVLPLSRVPPLRHVTLVSRVNGILAVVLCIGLAIALLTRRLAPPS